MSTTSNIPLGAVAVAVVAALVIGGLVGWLLHTPPDDRPAPIPSAVGAPVPSGIERQLIGALISLYDNDRAPATRGVIVEDLAGVGVRPLDTTAGRNFDAQLHKAVLTAPAAHPSQVGLIADTMRSGWVARSGVVRFAEVVVFVAPSEVDPR